MSKKTTISQKDIVELLSEKHRNAKDTWYVKDGRLQKSIAKKATYTEKLAPPPDSGSRLTKSYVHGPPNHAIVYTTLPELLEKRSQENPDEEGHVFWTLRDDSRLQRESISFSDLSEKSAILASNFLEMGLEQGDRIAIIGSNCPDWVYVEYAALRIGICLIRLNSTLATAEDIRQAVFNQTCRALVVTPGHKDVILKKVIQLIPGTKTADDLLDKLPNMRLFIMGDHAGNNSKKIKSIQSLLVNSKHIEKVIQIQDGLDSHDMAIAYSTSGSSGTPKFVGITHFSYINDVLAMDDMKWEGSKAKFFNDRPFTWIGSGLHTAIVLGITIVHMDSCVTQSPDHTQVVLSVMEEENITVCIDMPIVMDQVRQDETKELRFPASVQCVLSGGERLSNEALNFYKETFEATCLMYASSETFVVSKRVMSMYIANEHPYRLKPLSHVEMKVTDNDEKIVPVGSPGKLWVRSPYLFQSYLNFNDFYNKPKLKSKPLFQVAGGRGQGLWFNTDDLAVVYEDGTVEVIGREKDLITRGDTVIYPYTYEEVLLKYPNVKDVYVYGVEDHEYGEEVGICVSFYKGHSASEQDLHTYCEEADLDPLPEYYIIIKEFPRLPNGKKDGKTLDAIIENKIGNDNSDGRSSDTDDSGNDDHESESESESGSGSESGSESETKSKSDSESDDE